MPFTVCFIISFLITSTLTKAEIKQPIGKLKPPVIQKPFKLKVKTKLYRVPGSAAISVAKQHGYRFFATHSNVISHSKGVCEFSGAVWQVGFNTICKIQGFHSSIGKCKKLRKGWKMKETTLTLASGTKIYSRHQTLTNSEYAIFLISLKNNNNKITSSHNMINTITLEGPEGGHDKWKEAYSHCSDSSYVR